MNEDEWYALMNAVREMQHWFPEGIVFIGGIAVYAHAVESVNAKAFAAQSHDADFMIALPDLVDLRDIEVLTPNRRLAKQQFIKGGFEFDVYVEGQHDLVVPTPEALAASEMKHGLRVANCEHLLILKAAALLDRKGTPKGDKDEDDVIRILLVAGSMDAGRLVRMTDGLLHEIERAVAGNAVLRLAKGNHHVAKSLRDVSLERLSELKEAHRLNYGGCRP